MLRKPQFCGAVKIMVYKLEKQDLKVTFANQDNMEPLVELVLGSEVRTFPLAEFANFWLEMIEMGRRALVSVLDSLPKEPRPKAEECSRWGLHALARHRDAPALRFVHQAAARFRVT